MYHNVHRFVKKAYDAKTVGEISLEGVFDRPHPYGEIFFDLFHMNHRGYSLIAKRIYEFLAAQIFSGGGVAPGENSKKANQLPVAEETPQILRQKAAKGENSSDTPKELNDYLMFLSENKIVQDKSQKVGSIVMNCNPFTNGHRFLIETARKKCDLLYIFVVEEDKSDFLFDDRLQMVIEGTADIDGVKVLPSGEFIISSDTFPEYFVKDKEQFVTINASNDLLLFATKIAPILDISIRFAGKEPLCQITRQYNLAMAELLPHHGIEFIEIERVEFEDKPISASWVRELLKEKNWAKLEELVPASTLRRLS